MELRMGNTCPGQQAIGDCLSNTKFELPKQINDPTESKPSIFCFCFPRFKNATFFEVTGLMKE